MQNRDWRRWMERRGVRPTNPAAAVPVVPLDSWVEPALRTTGDEFSDAAGGDDGLAAEMADPEWWTALDEAERRSSGAAREKASGSS